MILWRDPIRAAAAVVLLLGSASDGTGQSVTARVDENLRAEPNGTRLGVVTAGATLRSSGTRGQWVEVTLEGWMWTRSLQRTDRMGFDLVVSAEEGENLRESPSGRVVARLLRGTLFRELDRVTGWIRVQRALWIWGPSVELSDAEAPETGRDAAPERWLAGGASGSAILTGPDGDTVAHTRPGAQLRVVARQGNWARVQMDGWVWAPPGELEPESGDIETLELSPEELTGDPREYQGRVVTWDLQYISLERAERVRVDFYEGEPFLLTRPASGSTGFVYVAVPPERMSEVSGLTPLERITVVGRIRTAAAALTGNPIVELLELRRGG
jgi:hypothetical protein